MHKKYARTISFARKVIDNSVLRERIGTFLRDMDFDAFTFEQNEEI